MTNCEKPNMDLTELLSTMDFICQQEAEGVDCTALRDFIKPILQSKRVNIDYGEITESRDNY